MKKTVLYTLILSSMLFIASCGSSRQVTRVDTDETIDLSGRWNDTDSRLTADALMEQLLNGRWIERYAQQHSERPVLIVGLIRNKSHEHISAETFIKDLEKAIIQDGSARLVQAGDKREELRRERADQQEFASAATANRWGRELGADFIMQGTINTIVDEFARDKVVFYQVDLELTDLETNEIVWMGDKKIKKVIND